MTPNLNQNMSPPLHYHGKAEGHGSAKFIFPGFLALPEIFQASGHLIPGPRIPFPAKGELNIEEKQKVMAETSNLTSGARCIRDMRNMLDLELQNALFTRI